MKTMQFKILFFCKIGDLNLSLKYFNEIYLNFKILISDFNFFSDFESVPFCYYEQNLAQYYKSKRQNLRTTLKT